MTNIHEQEAVLLDLMEKMFCHALQEEPPELPANIEESMRSGLDCLVRGFWHQRRRQHEAAIDILKEIADHTPPETALDENLHLHAVASLAIGISALRTFKIVRAKQALAELRQDAERLNIPRLKNNVHHFEGMILLAQSDFEGAITRLDEAVRGYSQLEGLAIFRAMRAQASAGLAWAHVESGDQGQARRVIDQAQAQLGANAGRWDNTLLTCARARIARRLGDYQHAVKLYQAAIKQISQTSPDDPFVAIIHDYIGDSFLVMAEKATSSEREEMLNSAAYHYRQFDEWCSQTEAGARMIRSKYSWAKLFCIRGKLGDARRLAEEVESELREGDPPSNQLLGRTYAWLARIHHDFPNLAECQSYLGKAKALLRKSGSVWHLARTLVLEADLELTHGNLQTAMHSLGEAQIHADRSDVDHLLEGIPERLRTVPPVAWRRFMKSLADSERENWKMTQQLDLWTCLIDHALTPKSVAGELNRIIHEWGELVESKLPMGQKHTARLRWLVLLLRVAVESTARMVGHIRIEDSIIRRLDMSEVVSFTINGMSSLLNRKRRPIEFGCSVDDDCLIMADRDVVQHVLRALLTYSLTHSGASPFTTNCRVCMTTDSEAVTITIETDTSHSFGPDSPDPFHYDPISQGDVRHAGDMRLLSCGRVLREVGGSICVAKSEKLTFECRWPCAQRPRKEGDT